MHPFQHTTSKFCPACQTCQSDWRLTQLWMRKCRVHTHYHVHSHIHLIYVYIYIHRIHITYIYVYIYIQVILYQIVLYCIILFYIILDCIIFYLNIKDHVYMYVYIYIFVHIIRLNHVCIKWLIKAIHGLNPGTWSVLFRILIGGVTSCHKSRSIYRANESLNGIAQRLLWMVYGCFLEWCYLKLDGL